MTTDTFEVVRADIRSATERLVGEYERGSRWIAELQGELTEAQRQRRKLAAALEELLAMLEGRAREDLMQRIKVAELRIAEATPGAGRPRGAGRPAADGRRAALLEILCDWPESTIETFELTTALRARGLDVPARYVPNSLFQLARRGAASQLGRGIYRINRLHPELRAEMN